MDSDQNPVPETQNAHSRLLSDSTLEPTASPSRPNSPPPPPVTTLDEASLYDLIEVDPIQEETLIQSPPAGSAGDEDPLEEPLQSSSYKYTHGSDSPEPYLSRKCSPSYGPREQFRSKFSFSSSATEFQPTGVGAGLRNLGNTCFLNAILQCFTHTVPLVQGLRALGHVKKLCRRGNEGFCVLCVLCGHIEDSLSFSGRVVEPVDLVDNMSNISSCFRRYQQEDAHEFLQSLLDKVDTCCLDSKKNDEMSSHRSKLVEQVFGGRLISKLRCCNCSHFSNTYEPLIDLSLEIGDVDTLPSALESFTKVERIEDSETKFTCDNCKEEVLVEKQLLLDQAPSVAAFHLKRFKADGSYVVKIDKHVEYPLELDLGPYTSGSHNNDDGLKYELYGVVVHVGLTPSSGHYFSFVRSSPNTWHRLDDSRVYRVQEEFVLSQDAYILFYARKGTPWFSSIMESQKVLDRTTWNKSPRSVLDHAKITSCPSTINIDSCEDNEALDAPEKQKLPHVDVEVEMIDAPKGMAIGRSEGSPQNTVTDVKASAKLPCEARQVQGQGLPLNESRFNVRANNSSVACEASNSGGGTLKNYEQADKQGFSEVFHLVTPPASPSPTKIHDVGHGIPREQPKSEERHSSCKRQLSKDLDDSKKAEERREALRYLSKYNGPCSRRAMLVAAAMHGDQEADRKKKRTKVSPIQGAHRGSHHKSRPRTVI